MGVVQQQTPDVGAGGAREIELPHPGPPRRQRAEVEERQGHDAAFAVEEHGLEHRRREIRAQPVLDHADAATGLFLLHDGDQLDAEHGGAGGAVGSRGGKAGVMERQLGRLPEIKRQGSAGRRGSKQVTTSIITILAFGGVTPDPKGSTIV
jgi:hypothetical protein